MQLLGKRTLKNLRTCYVRLREDDNKIIWSLNPTRDYVLSIGYKALTANRRENL